jgi:hypothetical protein
MSIGPIGLGTMYVCSERPGWNGVLEGKTRSRSGLLGCSLIGTEVERSVYGNREEKMSHRA